MFHWLNTVSFKALCPQMLIALLVAEEVWASFGAQCWVTSANDGVHKGKPVGNEPWDPHYTGKAVDIRIKNVAEADRDAAVDKLRTWLGPTYVVIWEGKGTGNEHVHIQFGHVAAA